MSLSPPILPLPDDDAAIGSALDGAELLALLGACAHVTGDASILREHLRPDPLRLREPQGGLDPGQVAEAKQLCLAALRRFRDGGGEPTRPDHAHLRRIMEFIVGQDLDDRYLPLLEEELAVEGRDLRAPAWHVDRIDGTRSLRIAVIGAGMSGIAAGHRLAQAGVEHTIFEKNDDVGGTWFENSYPGCRVDVQNHMYSFSFAQRHDWPQYFSDRHVLADYFRRVADDLGVSDRIELRTEVVSCTWREDDAVWELVVRSDAGERIERFDAVVSAVGQLNRPKLPEIEGRDEFAGVAFHSARWDHDVDLAGKRVVVIGTGASACQFVPVIAREVAHLTVIQRTAPWLIPAERIHQDVADGFAWLLGHVPFYAQWYRFWLFWRGAEGMLPAATVDPDYPPTERAVSDRNDEMRALLTEYLRAMAGGDDELFEQMVPDYPPLSKRFVLDNGVWPATMREEHVSLVTTGIERIEPTGVRTTDGVLHEADVLIYGTGFQAADFLTPMRVTGRDGVDLHERWAGDARAYLGIVAPGFPNLFFLYGPNTNIVVNGSIIYFSECEVHYVLDCLRLLLDTGTRSIECRPDVHDAYNERIDAANQLRTWGFSSVSSWYKNDTGRSAQNWPHSVLEYWEQTRRADPDDYVLR
ncbi:MAG: NAD(P)/FAD-dependent oxidoreductase [Actinomycetota bacterium]